MAIINRPSIKPTIIINVLNVTVRNQICVSDVDRRITSSQIFRNRTLRIRRFSGTRKRLKLVRTDRLKQIRCQTTVQIKTSHIRYMRLWRVYPPMNKVLEDILEIARN